MTGVKIGRSAEGTVIIRIEHDAAPCAAARFGAASVVDGVRKRVIEIKRNAFAQRLSKCEGGAVETGRAVIGPGVQTALLRGVERPAPRGTDAVRKGYAVHTLQPVGLIQRV